MKGSFEVSFKGAGSATLIPLGRGLKPNYLWGEGFAGDVTPPKLAPPKDSWSCNIPKQSEMEDNKGRLKRKANYLGGDQDQLSMGGGGSNPRVLLPKLVYSPKGINAALPEFRLRYCLRFTISFDALFQAEKSVDDLLWGFVEGLNGISVNVWILLLGSMIRSMFQVPHTFSHILLSCVPLLLPLEFHPNPVYPTVQ